MLEHLGREQTITALGRTWRLSRLDRQTWAEWLAWARPLIPHPLDIAAEHVKGLPDDLARALVERAADEAGTHLQSNSGPVQMLLCSAEGATQMVWLLARPHHPDLTFDDAFAIAMELVARVGREGLRKILVTAEGRLPEEARPFCDLLSRILAADQPGHPEGEREAGLAPDRLVPDAGAAPAAVGAGAHDHP